MSKKIKDGSLYFRQKDIMRPLGAGLLIVGLVWFYIGMSMASYYIPCIITPLGLVLFIVGGSRHISDNDVAEQLARAMLDYDKPITDMTGYERVVLKQPSPVETAAYSFGTDAAYFKKGKNGTPISDRYTGAHFFFTRDTLMVIGRRVSMTELSEDPTTGVREFEDTYLLTGIAATLDEHSTTVKLSNTDKELAVKWHELVITEREGGAELLRIAVRNDMDVSDLCEEINRRGAAAHAAG